MVPSLKTEILSLPEFTARARLLAESTARAPDKLTVIGEAAPLGVKLTVVWPVWFVGRILRRCNADGSRKESWLSLGLPGLRLWDSFVVTVTTLEARVALTMSTDAPDGFARFTPERKERRPVPP